MFVTVEGPEGSGKSSVMKRVAERLQEEGVEVVLTREPGGTPIAEQIREVILNKENTKMDKITEALLYAASRRQHLVEKVWPLTKEGKLVISDKEIYELIQSKLESNIEQFAELELIKFLKLIWLPLKDIIQI